MPGRSAARLEIARSRAGPSGVCPHGHPDGIGWLDGFDELLVRCGLESNGAPEFQPDGRLRYGLHGRIANMPAHKVEVAIDGDTGRIAVRGTVDESRLFGSKLRLETSIETVVGRPGWSSATGNEPLRRRQRLRVALSHQLRRSAVAAGGEGVLPVKKLAPRDATAAADLPTWDIYGPETPGSMEVCFFIEPAADADGNTLVLLHNAAARRACA